MDGLTFDRKGGWSSFLKHGIALFNMEGSVVANSFFSSLLMVPKRLDTWKMGGGKTQRVGNETCCLRTWMRMQEKKRVPWLGQLQPYWRKRHFNKKEIINNPNTLEFFSLHFWMPLRSAAFQTAWGKKKRKTRRFPLNAAFVLKPKRMLTHSGSVQVIFGKLQWTWTPGQRPRQDLHHLLRESSPVAFGTIGLKSQFGMEEVHFLRHKAVVFSFWDLNQLDQFWVHVFRSIQPNASRYRDKSDKPSGMLLMGPAFLMLFHPFCNVCMLRCILHFCHFSQSWTRAPGMLVLLCQTSAVINGSLGTSVLPIQLQDLCSSRANSRGTAAPPAVAGQAPA